MLYAVGLKSLFLGRILYSEEGENEKEKEKATYMLFTDYLEECEG